MRERLEVIGGHSIIANSTHASSRSRLNDLHGFAVKQWNGFEIGKCHGYNVVERDLLLC